jgi:hypothetical protein
MAVQPVPTRAHRQAAVLLVRVLVAVGLLVDAFVHLHLAAGYQEASPGGLGLGTLFRIQAVLAAAAAVYVMARGTRRAYLVALLVAGAALAAVLISRYVDLPAVGPLPPMYEPLWYPEKAVSAAAEALAVALAAVALRRRLLGRPSAN